MKFNAILVLFSGCLVSFSTFAALPPEYDLENPYYIKFCATSQWVPKRHPEIAGVPTGHTVAYLKGACLDSHPGKLPTLRLCAEGEKDLRDIESGVGVSTDGAFKNTVFSAIPGYAAMMTGGLTPDEVYDENRQEKLFTQYTELGFFDGITLHNSEKILGRFYNRYQAVEARIEELKNNPEKQFAALRERARIVAEWTMGTEFALSLSRSLFCMNVPVNRQVLGTAISHLNTLNFELKGSKGTPWRGTVKPNSDYEWDFLYNNCDHTGFNLLASIGIVKEIPTDVSFLKQIRHTAIPGASLLKVFGRLLKNQPTIDSLYKLPILRKMVLEKNWAPLAKGSWLEVIPFHEKNDLYEDTSRYFRNHEPAMTTSAFTAILAKYLPLGSATIAHDLDLSGKRLDGYLNNPNYAYLEDSNSLVAHDLFMTKRLITLFDEIRNEIHSSEFERQPQAFQDFVRKLEILVEEYTHPPLIEKVNAVRR
jgi:hypothetical protein